MTRSPPAPRLGRVLSPGQLQALDWFARQGRPCRAGPTLKSASITALVAADLLEIQQTRSANLYAITEAGRAALERATSKRSPT